MDKQPKVGNKVHFILAHGPHEGQHRDATVTQVYESDMAEKAKAPMPHACSLGVALQQGDDFLEWRDVQVQRTVMRLNPETKKQEPQVITAVEHRQMPRETLAIVHARYSAEAENNTWHWKEN